MCFSLISLREAFADAWVVLEVSTRYLKEADRAGKLGGSSLLHFVLIPLGRAFLSINLPAIP
jgi:hypothetical protein